MTAKDEDIRRRVASMDPMIPSECDGSLSCFFCHADRGEDHELDCLWLVCQPDIDEAIAAMVMTQHVGFAVDRVHWIRFGGKLIYP